MIIIYVTHENETAAERVVKHLLEQRLIACSNMMSIQSDYRWEEKPTQSIEVVTLLKTKEELWETVRDEITKIHPYKIPCIIKMGVEANAAYEQWVREETK